MSVSSTVDRSDAATTAQQMTGGDALAEMLIRNGVDTIFALPGVQLDGLFNAFWSRQDRLRILHTRHEQATAYMADGYARVTGREGVCAVVPGPGLLNAGAALSTAYACNSPVLCVSGQIQSALIDHGRGLLHEIHDQLGMIRHITKQAERADRAVDVPAVVDRAFAALRSGRMRPVEIEVPQDTLFAEDDIALRGPTPERVLAQPDGARVEEAAAILAAAKSPIIYSGGGVIRGRAWDELRKVAEWLQAPVVQTSNGKGAISDRHYLAQNNVGELGLYELADVALVVGTRFLNDYSEPRAVSKTAKVVRIDIDAEEISRDITPDVAMIADAKAGLAALYELLTAKGAGRLSREAELLEYRKGVHKTVFGLSPQADFGMAIRNALPDDGVIVGEKTQVAYWSDYGMPIYEPNTYLTTGYQGTLGWGFCTALGAKVGRPDTPVVSINGDGGFGFGLNELATMAQHEIPLIALVFNDSAYGNVKRIQEVDMGGRVIASDLRNPDYLKLADAFGVVGRRTETPRGLQTAIEDSIKANEPTLIEIPVGQMPNPWKLLGLR